MFKFISQLISSILRRFCHTYLNERGDFYISDGVRIILAVVLGALLLGALTLLFNSTIIPKITQVISDLFN